MKRPLLCVGFSMLISLFFLTVTDSQVLSVTTLFFSAAVFLFSVINKKSRQVLFLPVISISVCLACLLLMFSLGSYKSATSFVGKQCTIRATLKQTPDFSKENRRYYAIAKIKTIDGQKVRTDIKLSLSEKAEITADNEILFDALIYKTGSDIKDITNYYKSERLYIGCYNISNLKITRNDFKGYYSFKEKLTEYITDIFLKRFDRDTAGFLISLLTGDKTFLSDEIYRNFQRTGVSHLMAVSGLHLSVWVIFMGMLVDKKRKSSVLLNLTMASVVLFIMVIASFSGSVKRAGFMCLLQLIGQMLSKRSDSLNSLGFSVTLILIINPYSVFDIGFILSFLSTLSILVLALPLSEKFIKQKYFVSLPQFVKRLLIPVITSLTISFSVSLFTFPVIALKFGYISLISPLTNILFLPVTFILILCNGLFVLFSFSTVLSTPLALACNLLTKYSIVITSFLSNFRYASVPVEKDYIYIWFVAIMCIALVFYHSKLNKQLVKIIISLCLIVISFTSVLSFSRNISAYELHLIPAEEKLCVIVSMNSQAVLIGYNDSYYFEENVQDILRRNNLHLSAIIAPDSKDAKDFAEKNNASQKFLSNNCTVSIMNTITINQSDNTTVISGNSAEFIIINNEYLQQTDKCDIMIYYSNYSDPELLPEHNDTVLCKTVDNQSDVYIKVYSDGECKTGGEAIG